MIRAWYHYLSDAGPSPPDAPTAALGAVGFSLTPYPASSPCCGGLLFCPRIDSQIFAFLSRFDQLELERIIVVVCGPGGNYNLESWPLLATGVGDIIVWREAGETAVAIAARFQRWQQVDELLASPLIRNNLVGRSRVWLQFLRRLLEVARFSQAPILLWGETGTGKELAARLIHTLDPRPQKGNLVVVDCATIVPELSGSEFFGHEKGAFTGAVAPREGAFALANGGTLFLDEITELSPPLQAQLLRVVQYGLYKKVGGNTWQQTRFRLISAANRELSAEVAAGRFREDLYYRLAGITLRLPALRERVDDILLLAEHFFRELQPESDPPILDEAVKAYLISRDYPGNIRELKQLIGRIATRHPGQGMITLSLLPPEDRPSPGAALPVWQDQAFENALRRALLLGVRLKDIKAAVTETAIRLAIEEAGDNTKAAARLGVTPRLIQAHRAAGRRPPGF